ncbi:MAG TPA: dihydropteroate synthase [Candidatus Nesterenkonia stercoripullorum]|uniref:Dihydropteroate synthase n=1 Tax=Candidatus Nesterenkonia stercoripullorum TaxID=2838701 RepID=A0A9D1UR53_9MICC|nr:dihydropteroate synthase [Candidatus Nesterenkonia stercoripullorum]
MDAMGAMPGTGPNTGPLPVVRRRAAQISFAQLPQDRTLLMGILNLTPDSFSDGGKHSGRGADESSVQAGLRMHYAGAHMIDVGGESTRPGAEPISSAQERERILPTVEALVAAGVFVSVDTRHPETAEAVLKVAPSADQVLVNDVSGLQTAQGMPELIARSGAHVVITHNRGDAQTMQSKADYRDVLSEVLEELGALRQRYLDAGAAPEQIILDPGVGFAKTSAQSWELISHLEEFVKRSAAWGHRVLFGASRKGLLGDQLADEAGPRPPDRRDIATAGLSLLAAQAGVWAVRVHDVEASSDTVRVARALGAVPAALSGSAGGQ